MRVPKFLRDVDQQGAVVRTYDYDDESIIVVDLGQMADDIEADVVGNTAIIVIDDRQLEFELPAEASDISVKNGILTIVE